MVSLIAGMNSRVITTKSRHPRSLDPQDLSELFMNSGTTQVASTASVNEALEEACALAGDDTLIIVTGSLFVAAEAREHILDITPELYPDLLSGNSR